MQSYMCSSAPRVAAIKSVTDFVQGKSLETITQDLYLLDLALPAARQQSQKGKGKVSMLAYCCKPGCTETTSLLSHALM